MTSTDRRRQGSALFITVMVMLLLGMIGFAGLNAVSRDQQIAGFQNRQRIAFFAAEGGISKGMETLTTNQTPVIPTTSLGDSTIYPYGQPSYQPDTTVADPLEGLGVGAFPGMSLNIGQGGVPTYQLNYWRMRVQGDAPGGTVARVEAVAGALVAN